MTIKLIIATCGDDYAIGKDNKLLTHVPEDLRYFKKQTENKIVVMGSSTFRSLPFDGGLPNRRNYVYSRYMTKEFENIIYLRYMSDFSKYCLDSTPVDVWIIGGASVYSQFKDIVYEVHWTQINKSFPEADIRFDMSFVLDTNTFEKVSEEILCDIATVKVYRRLEDKNE